MTHQAGSTATPAVVPPRSRWRAHLLGVALAVIGGPITFGALALAAEVPKALAEPIRLQVLPALLACAILAATAFATVRSSVGAAIAGGVWLAAGLVGLLLPGQADALLQLVPETALGGAPRAGAALLLHGGGAAAIGGTLGGTAIAATVARQRGQFAERSEHIAIDTGDVARPPLSRLVAHIAAPVLSLALAVLGLQILSGTETAALWSAIPGSDPLAGPVPWLITVVALLIAVGGPPLLGAWSSLGPAAGAVTWLGAAVGYLIAPAIAFTWSAAPNPLAPYVEDVTGWAVHAVGLSLAVGAALGGAAFGIHGARRDGAAHERREYRIARRAAAAGS